MDYLFEDSREDRLIDDYLYSGCKQGSKSTFGVDQQFAKPIEDEDLFGVAEAQDEMLTEEDALLPELDRSERSTDFGKDPFGMQSEILGDKNINSPGSIFEDEILGPLKIDSEKSDHALSELNEIFVDDYSVSSCDDICPNINNENTCPDKSYSRQKPPPPPSPAQIKKQRMKELILEQLRARSDGPKKIGTGLEEGFIEVKLDTHELKSDSNSKFIFNRLFNKSKKAGSPESKNKSWAAQKDILLKRISAQKRKVWDSFQRPTDAYNEEEELVEMQQDDEPADNEGDDDQGEQLNDLDRDDGDGFEDLEREDIASSDDEEQEDRVSPSNQRYNGEDNDDEEVQLDDEEDDFASKQEFVADEVDETSSYSDEENSDDEGVNAPTSQKGDQIGSEESDSDEDIEGDFSLDLDDEDSSSKETRRRRAIFIDDEASEDDD